jgi:hypothetical protein
LHEDGQLFHTEAVMSIDNDLDCEQLISRLAGPLSPPARAAFRAAAEDAVARLPCRGEGAVYRAVAGLQRTFFDPPSDGRALWGIEQELARASKLKAAPAIEYLGDLRHVRYRKQAR